MNKKQEFTAKILILYTSGIMILILSGVVLGSIVTASIFIELSIWIKIFFSIIYFLGALSGVYNIKEAINIAFDEKGI